MADKTASVVVNHIDGNWTYSPKPVIKYIAKVKQTRMPKKNTLRVTGARERRRELGKGLEQIIEELTIYINSPVEANCKGFEDEVRAIFVAGLPPGTEYHTLSTARDTSRLAIAPGRGSQYSSTMILTLYSQAAKGDPSPIDDCFVKVFEGGVQVGTAARMLDFDGDDFNVTEDAPNNQFDIESNAIHTNQADEIHQITNKASPVGADELVIEDSAASWAKKRVSITNLPGGADPDAIHDNVADEIHQITLKGTPVGADELVIEDSAASWAKKRATITSLGIGTDSDAIHDNVADEIHQITLKGTPVAADELVIEDSAASWAKKRIAISTLPAGSPSFGIPTGDIDIGDSAAEGSSGDATRADHQHAFTAPGAGYPLDVAATEDDGTATTPARSDHVHAHGSGYSANAHHNQSHGSSDHTAESDAEAIHDNVDGEINAIGVKGTPVGADILVIEDSAATWAKKKITLSSLPGGLSGSGTTNYLAKWDSDLTDSTIVDDGSTVTMDVGDLVLDDIRLIRDGTMQILRITPTIGNSIMSVRLFPIGTEDATYLYLSNDSDTNNWAYCALYVDGATAHFMFGESGTPSQSVTSLDIADGITVTDAGEVTKIGQDTPSTDDFLQWDGSKAIWAPGGTTDADAIHDNVANEITAITAKTAPVSADEFIIEDSEAAFVKKALTYGNLESTLSITQSQISDLDHTDTDAIHDNVADEIHLITEKVTPVGADVLVIEDSVASWAKKRVQITNLPAGAPSFGAPTGNIDIGDAAVEGTSGDATRADHQHQFTAPGAGYPLDTANTESDGTATTPARSDHVHRLGAHVHSATAGEGGQPDWDNVWSDAAHDHSVAGEGGNIPEASVTFSATGHDHDGVGSENVDYTDLDNIPSTFNPTAHDLTSAYHTDSGLTAGQYLRADSATTFSFGTRKFSITACIVSPAAGYHTVWRAPIAATLVEVQGRQKGGTSTVINARYNGTTDVLTSDLTLTSADTWYSSTGINGAADNWSIDDWLEVEVVTLGGATEITIQVEYTEP